jgi:hypothetical protein
MAGGSRPRVPDLTHRCYVNTAKPRAKGTCRVEVAQSRAASAQARTSRFHQRILHRFRWNPDINPQERKKRLTPSGFSGSRERSEIKRFRINALFGLDDHFPALLGKATRRNEQGARSSLKPSLKPLLCGCSRFHRDRQTGGGVGSSRMGYVRLESAQYGLSRGTRDWLPTSVRTA